MSRTMKNRLVIGLALTAMAVNLSGCTTASRIWARITERPAKLEIRPIKTDLASLKSTTTPVDRLYGQARRAIGARDYGTALDLLQMAKQRDPRDVRVLNALGVVYDKLGRFDLSDRYYQAALEVEPTSTIALANVEYSHKLSGRYREQATFLADAKIEPVLPLAPPSLRVMATPEPTFALASAAPVKRLEPLLLGSSLVVVNATGRVGGEQPVMMYLASAKWSVSPATPTGAVKATSEIVYSNQHRALAESLARTLPFPARLKPCGETCEGVQLVVGANVRLPVTVARGRA